MNSIPKHCSARLSLFVFFLSFVYKNKYKVVFMFHVNCVRMCENKPANKNKNISTTIYK